MTRNHPSPVEPAPSSAASASSSASVPSAPSPKPATAPASPSPLQQELDAHNKRGGGWWQWIVVILMVAAAGYYLYFGGAHNGAQTKGGEADSSGRARGGGRRGPSVIPVVTEKVKTGDIDVVVDGLGTVTPLATVTVKSRVDGELIKVLYTEGQMVKEGELLAQIDPRPFEVALAQAEGQLMRDEALLKNARLDLERYQGLYKKDAIPQQTLTAQESTVAQYEGVVKTDQGAVDNARLNVTYCNITSPINGRVGLRIVDKGNMIRAGDTAGLVVITQVQPTSVVFPIASKNVPAVLTRVNAGEKLRVVALDERRDKKVAEGTLLTVDNAQDALSSTLKCKALFDNKDYMLYPNRFVNMDLYLETKRNVILVNPAAIQRGSSQAPLYVFILNPDNTVSMRNIETGQERADAVEVLKGLKPGEIVVTAGVDKLQEGSKVTLGDMNSATEAEKQGGDGASHRQGDAKGPGTSAAPGTSDVPGAPNVPASSAGPGSSGSGEGKRRHRERSATNSPSTEPKPGANAPSESRPTP